MERIERINKTGNCKLIIEGNKLWLELVEGGKPIYEDRYIGQLPNEVIESLEKDFGVTLKDKIREK